MASAFFSHTIGKRREMKYKMNDTEELLSFTVQNARMGLEGISHLLKITRDETFRTTLGRQYAEYNAYVQEGADMLRTSENKVPEVNAVAKAGSYLSAEINSALDRSTEQLAEMMIKGTTTGIVKLIRKRNAYTGADEGARSLAGRLICAEERNVEEMKQFL